MDSSAPLYKRAEGETLLEYRDRRQHELAAFRGSPGFQAVMDVIQSEIVLAFQEERQADSREKLWSAREKWRALQHLYDRLNAETMNLARKRERDEEAYERSRDHAKFEEEVRKAAEAYKRSIPAPARG
jgi:hypothetical protein